jgi:hypothetical protein
VEEPPAPGLEEMETELLSQPVLSCQRRAREADTTDEHPSIPPALRAHASSSPLAAWMLPVCEFLAARELPSDPQLRSTVGSWLVSTLRSVERMCSPPPPSRHVRWADDVDHAAELPPPLPFIHPASLPPPPHSLGAGPSPLHGSTAPSAPIPPLSPLAPSFTSVPPRPFPHLTPPPVTSPSPHVSSVPSAGEWTEVRSRRSASVRRAREVQADSPSVPAAWVRGCVPAAVQQPPPPPSGPAAAAALLSRPAPVAQRLPPARRPLHGETQTAVAALQPVYLQMRSRISLQEVRQALRWLGDSQYRFDGRELLWFSFFGPPLSPVLEILCRTPDIAAALHSRLAAAPPHRYAVLADCDPTLPLLPALRKKPAAIARSQAAFVQRAAHAICSTRSWLVGAWFQRRSPALSPAIEAQVSALSTSSLPSRFT